MKQSTQCRWKGTSPADADQPPTDDEPAALTHRQITALPFIISAPTLAEGARRAGLVRTSIYRWMGDDQFRTRFERLRDEALSLAQAEMKGVALKGAMVLAEMLDDPSSRHPTPGSSDCRLCGIQDR